jgi:hypothetical protein
LVQNLVQKFENVKYLEKQKPLKRLCISGLGMVEATGLEPATPCL